MSIPIKNSPSKEGNFKQSSFRSARYWTIRGLTASLLLLAALLPVISALALNVWLNGQLDWHEFKLEVAVACLALVIIAYPVFYLLKWNRGKLSAGLILGKIFKC